MSSCQERFYKKIRVNVYIPNISIDELAEIKALVDKLKAARKPQADPETEQAKDEANKEWCDKWRESVK